MDMCKAMKDNNRKMRVAGIIDYLRSEGASDETIIMEVQKVYDVTREYVLAILKEEAA